jgi:hypothetical protein
MTIGIGGAGSKIATTLDPNATIINVSETELSKIQEAGRRILASLHHAGGQFRGSRKDPSIGRDAFQSLRRELTQLARGDLVFTSTGGGTGNGLASALIEELTDLDEDLQPAEKTQFALVLPFAKLEPAEFTRNTIDLLGGPISRAIDSGSTGNIFLFSNRLKFQSRLREDRFNRMISDSLSVLQAVPQKNDTMDLLDGHIDYEDFDHFLSRPFFNHFTYFDYDPGVAFGDQLDANPNPLLLPPESPIEALFLLEVPKGGDPTAFYEILEYFAKLDVSPVYSVVENPDRDKPFVTVSLLYSRKPAELLDDFNRISDEHAQAKVRKSLEQHIELPKLEVDLKSRVEREAKQGAAGEDVLGVLKRLGKL